MSQPRPHWDTPKGTRLPLLNQRGKEYMEVKYRVVWCREEHPDWRFKTTFVQLGETHAIAFAEVLDANGVAIANAHKREDKGHFADFLEKAETGALGRALALCGYGTQFAADELDEGERIVDAPANPPAPPVDPEDPRTWIYPFKYPEGAHGIALGDLGTDGMIAAEKQLSNWKQGFATGKTKTPFPEEAERFIGALRQLMKQPSKGGKK